MFKKLVYLILSSVVLTSSFLIAELEYSIRDIGTLQMHSSQAIAINDQGQILGWYNIDGSDSGKHFFLRDKDGTLHEVPNVDWSFETISGVYLMQIEWRFLMDDGRAYGLLYSPNGNPFLFMWDKQHGLIELGSLPGDAVAINYAGQVLIDSVIEYHEGNAIQYPAIWQNGEITKLNGLEGNAGIPSDESIAYDMNNQGEVVGKSVVNLVHKNGIYKQVHAVKWVNGQAIDLHNKVTKRPESCATAINDASEVLIEGFFLHANGKLINIGCGVNGKTTDTKYVYFKDFGIFNKFGAQILSPNTISGKVTGDPDSIWMSCQEIASVNDNGEAVANGVTIYGEPHAMLLTPVQPK